MAGKNKGHSHRGPPSWVSDKDGEVPPGAMSAGFLDGERTFVARMKEDETNMWIPAQLIPSTRKCVAAWKNKVQSSHRYEVLCNCEPEWVKMKKGDLIPRKALAMTNSETIYIGRATYKKDQLIGTVIDKNGKCYVANKRSVFEYEVYELLILSQHDIDELYKKETAGYFKKGLSSINSVWNNYVGGGNSNGSSTHSKGPWIACEDGNVPPGAVAGGKNHLGQVFVARMKVKGEWLPGKMIPTYRKCFVSYDGKELSSTHYEVLCDIDAQWKTLEAGDKPPADVFVCSKFEGNEMCVGRKRIDDTTTSLGKVRIKYGKCGKCYTLMNKKEESFEKYEILVDGHDKSSKRTGSKDDSPHGKKKVYNSSDDDENHGRKVGSSKARKSRSPEKYDSDEDGSRRGKRVTSSRHRSSGAGAAKYDSDENGGRQGKRVTSSRHRSPGTGTAKYDSDNDKSRSKSHERSSRKPKARHASGSDEDRGKGKGHQESSRGAAHSSTLHKGNSNVWVACHDGKYPPNAVVGGKNHVGPIYVARLFHENAVLPGKLIPTYGYCYSSNKGVEIRSKSYEVLCDKDISWQSLSSKDRLPKNAFYAGVTSKGHPLYVGRVEIDNSTYIGKVLETDMCCYIVKQRVELRFKEYEILLTKTSSVNRASKKTGKHSKKKTSHLSESESSASSRSRSESPEESREEKEKEKPRKKNEGTGKATAGFTNYMNAKGGTGSSKTKDKNDSSSWSGVEKDSWPMFYHPSVASSRGTRTNQFSDVSAHNRDTVAAHANYTSSRSVSMYDPQETNTSFPVHGTTPVRGLSNNNGPWEAALDGYVPPGATTACPDNANQFLARAKHESCLLPGCVSSGVGCFVIYNGRMVKKNQYEVLCMQGTEWFNMREGDEIPGNVVPCGYGSHGQNLFFGRIQKLNSSRQPITYIGVVEETGSKCKIYIEGRVELQNDYEILVERRSPSSLVRSTSQDDLDQRSVCTMQQQLLAASAQETMQQRMQQQHLTSSAQQQRSVSAMQQQYLSASAQQQRSVSTIQQPIIQQRDEQATNPRTAISTVQGVIQQYDVQANAGDDQPRRGSMEQPRRRSLQPAYDTSSVGGATSRHCLMDASVVLTGNSVLVPSPSGPPPSYGFTSPSVLNAINNQEERDEAMRQYPPNKPFP